jgi:hypothetical protein
LANFAFEPRVKWTIKDRATIWEPYLRANFWEDWMTNPNTTYGVVDQVPLIGNGQRVEIGGGITGKNPSGFQVYLNGAYQVKLSNSGGGFIGSAGLRFTF